MKNCRLMDFQPDLRLLQDRKAPVKSQKLQNHKATNTFFAFHSGNNANLQYKNLHPQFEFWKRLMISLVYPLLK